MTQIIDTETDIIIPTDPAQRAKFEGKIKEWSDAQTKIEGLQSLQKEIANGAKEDFGTKTQHFTKMAKWQHKDNFDQDKAKQDALQDAFMTLRDSPVDYSAEGATGPAGEPGEPGPDSNGPGLNGAAGPDVDEELFDDRLAG